MTYVPTFCNAPGCEYVTAKGSTLCTFHTEAARVAASAATQHSMAQLQPIAWCAVVSCHNEATTTWDDLRLCSHHGKYGTLVRGMQTDLRLTKQSRRFWRVASIIMFTALTIRIVIDVLGA